jgi:C4-dicarboxylate-specific signal transduction histidine kinase
MLHLKRAVLLRIPHSRDFAAFSLALRTSHLTPAFFTTKPTGQGTGLGLSLSYDIVKAQGGELKVKTKEREGSEFIIQLTN